MLSLEYTNAFVFIECLNTYHTRNIYIQTYLFNNIIYNFLNMVITENMNAENF